MAKAGKTHDITVADGVTTKGFMLARDGSGRRGVTIQDYRTIAPRQLSDAELTHAQLPVEVEMVWFQEDWRKGLGGRNHRLDAKQLASSLDVDASLGTYLALARKLTASTGDNDPTEWVPSGFAVSGEPWAFVGRDTYRWDYTNKRWQWKAVSTNGSVIYRNGVPYKTDVFVPGWADDVGSGGSYVSNDEPMRYLHRSLELAIEDNTNWTQVNGTGSTNPESFKYFAAADGKLWGGYVADAADSNEDTLNSPVFDATSSGVATSTTSVTLSHTVLANSTQRLLLVGISVEDTATADPSSVTYNSISMTKLSSSTNGNTYSAIYYLVAPATGANDVVVTFSSTMDSVIVGAASWSNVDQTTPLGTVATNTGSGANPSISVTAAVGDIVVDVVSHAFSTAPTVDGSQSQLWNRVPAGSPNRGFASRETAAGTPVSMDWTVSAGDWASVGVAIKHSLSATDSTTFGVTAAPATNLSVGDVIRVDSELMLVTAVSDTPAGYPYVTVVRGYRGSEAVVHNSVASIYTMTENRHHIRSSTDPTSAANWSGPTGVEIGDSSAEITALIGVGSNLFICKTDGLYKYDGTDVTELRPELKAIRHPDNFRNAFSWNDRIYLPLGSGGMLELDTSDLSIRDVSFSEVMPDQSQFHGRVIAMYGDTTRLFALVDETGSDTYHLLMCVYLTIDGSTDCRWHHLGSISYTSGASGQDNHLDHAALFVEAIRGDTDDDHHRLLVGVEGKLDTDDLLPYFLPLSTVDVEDEFTDAADVEAVTVKWDGNLSKVDKQFSSITCNTENLGATGGSNHYIEVQYRVDGGSWKYATSTSSPPDGQSASTLTSSPQTIDFASGVTGRVLELKFILVRKTTDDGTTPKLLDFTLTAQLRPSAVKTVPLTVYLADRQELLNGALGGTPNSDLTQLRTWNGQAAEVTLEMPSGPSGTTSRTCIFLPGVMVEEEIAHEAGRRSEYAVTMLLAEV